MNQDQPVRKFVTTFHYGDSEYWLSRIQVLDLPYIPPNTTHSLLDELRWFWRVLTAAPHEEVMLLNCSSGRIYPDLLACIVIGFFPYAIRPVIVLAGAMYNPNQGLRHVIERLVIKLADRAIHRYAVWSSEELEAMPRLWGINRNKLRRCNYFFTFKEQEWNVPIREHGDYIFAGGNSQRDYEPLLQAARLLPDYRFVLATRLLNKRTDLPANVTARAVPHAEYVELMRGAAAVVIPMRKGMSRSAGQQTYLNAMLLGKPTIVNESFGVRDVIEDRQTGWIVAGSPESYAEILRWILDPANADVVNAVSANARREVLEHYTYEHHLRGLLAVIDDALKSPDVIAHSRLSRNKST